MDQRRIFLLYREEAVRERILDFLSRGFEAEEFSLRSLKKELVRGGLAKQVRLLVLFEDEAPVKLRPFEKVGWQKDPRLVLLIDEQGRLFPLKRKNEEV